MNRLFFHYFFSLLFSVVTLLMATALAAQDIWDDLEVEEDHTNAKVLRYVAKQRAMEGNMSAKERAHMRDINNNTCGSMSVGNVSDTKGDVENIVIIKGDLINANNKCN